MPAVTPQQQWVADKLRNDYGHARIMDAGNGTVLILASTDTQTISRLFVDKHGAAWPAVPREVSRVFELATAHVRVPCPACGYPARRPSCPRCRHPITTEALNA